MKSPTSLRHDVIRNTWIGAVLGVTVLAVYLIAMLPNATGDRLEWAMTILYLSGMPSVLLLDAIPQRFAGVTLVMSLLCVPLNLAFVGAAIAVVGRAFRR